MTSRECVIKTIKFQSPDRLPYKLPDEYGSDIYVYEIEPSPDYRPKYKKIFTDEWSAVWENIGVCKLGEVKEFPLKSWDDFPKLKIPDIREQGRWKNIKLARSLAGDKFLLGKGVSLYERVHFIRGLENTWMDIYTNRDDLIKLIDILVDMNPYILQQYADNGFDGIIWNDDWGLQKSLMIAPEIWCEIWKPRYEKIYKTAHEYGIFTFLHSCGYIVDILDDLIEVGLDVIHMDQQENMGLELLGRPQGGFIPRWYEDPKGAGHSERALKIMCEEFLRLSIKKNKHSKISRMPVVS